MTPLSRQASLDGIRALAIVAVMGLHTDDRVFSGGFYGVDAFFVLSAFLISTLLKRELSQREGQLAFGAFYARRALRLLPALLAWLVLVALPTSFVTGETDKVLSSSAGALLYYGNYLLAFDVRAVGSAYSHIWSLAIEEQFYFVWPVTLWVLSRAISRTAQRRALLTAVPLTLCLFVVTERSFGGGTNYFLPTGHLFPIACGLAAAELAPVLRAQAWSVLAVPAGVTSYVALVCRYRFLPQDTLSKTLGTLALGVAIASMILATLTRPSKLLSQPTLVWLGRRSYGLYLYHRTIAVLVPSLIPGIRLTFDAPLVLGLSVLLTELSWRFVEQPISTWGRRRLAARRPTPAPDRLHARREPRA